MNIKERKINGITEIVNAYETYNGAKRNSLTDLLDNLHKSNRITPQDMASLQLAVNDYKDYLFNAICNSKRIRVLFIEPLGREGKKHIPNYPLKDISKIIFPEQEKTTPDNEEEFPFISVFEGEK